MVSLHERAGRFDSNPARQTAPFTCNVIALKDVCSTGQGIQHFRISNCGKSRNKFGQGFGANSETCPSWERKPGATHSSENQRAPRNLLGIPPQKRQFTRRFLDKPHPTAGPISDQFPWHLCTNGHSASSRNRIFAMPMRLQHICSTLLGFRIGLCDDGRHAMRS